MMPDASSQMLNFFCKGMQRQSYYLQYKQYR